MSDSSNVRAQLQTLRIPKDQRPTAGTSRRRWPVVFFVLLLLAITVAGGLYVVRGRNALTASAAASAAEVRLLTVAARRDPPPPPPVLTATGKIVSDHRVLVFTKVSGQIVALYFEQGDRVQEGQTLARIEDVNYRARRDEAAALLEKAKASLAYHRVNFARVAKLFETESTPAIEYADAQRAVQEAEAQVAAAQASLDFTRKALNDCEVRAPITGVILERNVEIGDFVAAEGGRGAQANAQLTSIADMSALRVEVDVSELDIARLRQEMPCTVTPDAYKDRKYPGRVMWIDPGANYAKATVGVKVRIENPDDYLRVEGSAQVAFLNEQPPPAPASTAATTQPTSTTIPTTPSSSAPAVAPGATSPPAPAIWIPATACRRDPSGNRGTVFVAVDGRLHATPVTIGRTSGADLEITAGLTEGQSLAADHVDQLRDGQRLRP